MSAPPACFCHSAAERHRCTDEICPYSGANEPEPAEEELPMTREDWIEIVSPMIAPEDMAAKLAAL